MGRRKRPYSPVEAEQVEKMAASGISMADIAFYLDMHEDTCRKLYHDTWKKGKLKANHNVAAALYNKAVKDKDTAAMIFWAKTQLGWRETLRVDNTSSDGSMATNAAAQTAEQRAMAFMQRLDNLRKARKEQEKDNAGS